MLGVKSYEKKYINSCRTNLKSLIAEYKKTNSKNTGFEKLFVRNMIVALDAFFVHRIRAIEGKDGNPLNEVRMMAQSVLNNSGKLALDKTIKYNPDTAVVKLKPGDDIALTTAQFETLTKAFFIEIESKYR